MANKIIVTEETKKVTVNDTTVVVKTSSTQGPPGAPGAPGPQGPQGPAGVGIPTGGTTNQVLAKVDNTDFNTYWATLNSAVWGNITGLLSDQTDLQTVLNNKVDKTTTVSAGTGLSGGGALSSNITLSLSDTAVTPGSYTNANITVDAQGRITAASNGSIPVTSVFGRTGAVTAQEGDYSLTQLSDVTITTPSSGQVLKYNGTTWVNDSDAGGIADPGANGIVVRTALNTTTARTLTAGSSKISVSNGDGVAGNPTVDIVETNLILNNISGTLSISKGGTGQTTQTAAFNSLSPLTTKGDLVVHDGTNNIRLPIGTNGYVLTADSTTAEGVKWTAIPSAPVTSVFGRTGAVTAQEGDYSLNQLSDVTITTPSSGQVLKYNGTTWVNDSDAGGIADPGANGIVVRTALNTTTARTLIGTAGNIVITNGDGVSGNPTVDLASVGTPGTYVSVTTDAKGRVTAGSTTQAWSTITGTPTTLSGYGITDAVANLQGTPGVYQDTFANRPAAAVSGRLFVDTTNKIIQRDTGTAWETIGGTVTSVAVSSNNAAISVSGSPVTTNGTITLTANTFTASNPGIVPASGGGTTNYLRADGTWASPDGGVTSVFGRTGAVTAQEGDYSLTQLSDVTITTPSSGQVLKYNGTAWVNDTVAGGGMADPGANGIVVRTALNTTTARTLTAGSSKVSITNGDGVAGNPTVDVTEANLTLDNLGGTLSISKGGTGQTTQTTAFNALAPTTTKGDIVVHNGTNNVRLPVGTNGYVLTADSTVAEGVKWAAGGGGGGSSIDLYSYSFLGGF